MARKIDYASMFTLRKDGRYQVKYTDQDGVKRTLYDKDPERLWHKLNDPKEEKPTTFSDIARLWKDRKWDSYTDGTKASFSACYDRAVAELGDTVITEIQPYHVKNHLDRMRQQGFSASTMKTQKSVYNLIFQAAIVDEKIGKLIRINPVAEIKTPKSLKPAQKREAPEDDVVAAIRKSAQTDEFALFPLLLMSTGFRRGEALGLRWGNVDFNNKTITQDRQITFRGTAIEKAPKTENGVRSVPLLPDLEAVLKRPKSAKDTDFIFYGEDPSKCMCEVTYRRRWLSYCKRMGFVQITGTKQYTGKNNHTYEKHTYKPTITAHVFRHGYATLLFEAGVDEFTAQKLLGHADITTTRAIYTHLRNKKKNESIDKLRSFVQAQIEDADTRGRQ